MEAETTESQSTETFYKVLAWFHANQKRVIILIAVVAVVGLIVGIMSWNKDREDADANKQFFDLPIEASPTASLTGPSPNAFLDLASQYPNTSAGEYAVLLAAQSLFAEGKYPEAQAQFSKYVNDHPDSPLLAQASLGVAACLEAEGKIAEAVQQYRQVISSYPNEISVTSPAKLTLARLLEDQNQPEQAMSLYVDLARSQNPNDLWATEARERAQILLSTHPELMKEAQQQQQQASSANPSFSLSQPTRTVQPASAPTAPAPQIKAQIPPVNLLSIPAAPSNAPSKH
ncbi:MAG TPA: tetratricopeptide repeat protein [Verrucomicrobiae bacterium]|jgi:predicted negative regulator of RcsB-dependent stress response